MDGMEFLNAYLVTDSKGNCKALNLVTGLRSGGRASYERVLGCADPQFLFKGPSQKEIGGVCYVGLVEARPFLLFDGVPVALTGGHGLIVR